MSHRFVLLVALCGLLFAFATLLPHALQRTDKDFPFQGVEIFPSDAEIHYMARMREITDGFWQTGNTFYSAPKDQPYLQPPFPEMPPAYLALAFGADPIVLFFAWAGVCALALVVALTGAMASITGRKYKALLAVAALIFCGALLGAPWDLPHYLLGANAPGAFAPLRFARAVNPLWTVPWFFLAVWMLSRWWHNRSRWALLAFGLCATVLVYSYVYAWTYLAASGAVLLALCAWRREWRRCADLCVCGLVIVLAAVPYLLHLYATVHHPAYAESSLRLGVLNSHEPSFGVWALVAVVLVILTRKRWTAWPLITALLLGGLLAMNQQVITGRAIVVHHYHWYFFQPLTALFAMTFVLELLDRNFPVRWRAAAVSALLVAAVAFGLLHQYRAYQSMRAYWGGLQSLAPVLHYAKDNLHAGQVVYSTEVDVMDLVPIYSSADVYAATNANNYLIPIERARYVFFFELWVRGVSAEQAEREFPTTLRARLSSALYAIYYRETAGRYDAIPDEMVAENIKLYREYLALSDQEKIKKYPVDVIVLPPGMKETPAIATLKRVSQQVLSANGYTVRVMSVGTQ